MLLPSYVRGRVPFARFFRSSSAHPALSSPSAWSPPPPTPNRRVVVTGIGVVTPLAVGTANNWSRLLAGASGVRSLKVDDLKTTPDVLERLRGRGGGLGAPVDARELAMSPHYAAAAARKWPAFIHFALTAAAEAMNDAFGGGTAAGDGMGVKGSRKVGGTYVDAVRLSRQSTFAYDLTRFGVSIGAGMGSCADVAAAARTIDSSRTNKISLSPYFVPSILVNMPSGLASMEFGLQGPNLACSTACAAGAHAIGAALDAIRHGQADAMLCGGTESALDVVGLAGFGALRAMASNNSTSTCSSSTSSSRPFDDDRTGFVMGEGAGILVLEEREKAIARGARIYAEVRGVGYSGDAHHVTQPPAGGAGAQRCMAAALAVAGVDIEDVIYINAHATSTVVGDARELQAIGSLFFPGGGGGDCDGVEDEEDERAERQDGAGMEKGTTTPTPTPTPTPPLPAPRTTIPTTPRTYVSSTKGATGHMLGAAGAVEAAFTVLTLHHRVAPPTAHLTACGGARKGTTVPASALVRGAPRELPATGRLAALSNSFGFGGTNAALVFATHDKAEGSVDDVRRET